MLYTSSTWKLAVVLKEPGLNANEIQKDNATLIEDAIAIIVPNIELDATFSEGKTFPIPAYPYTIPIESQEEWQDWENWQVSYRELQKATDLRFLTGLNAKTRDFIHSLSLPNPSSPLLAETEFVSSSSSVFGTNQSTAIGHDGVIIESPKISHKSTKFFAVEQDSFKISPDHNRIIQISSSEIGSPENSISQVSPFEVGSTQIGFGKVDSFESGTPEIGISQIGVSQTRGTQVRPFENSIAEISTQRTRSAHDSSRKVSISQVSIPKINRRQISPPQISSFEIDSTEVSFASSISSEQFFSVHNSTSEITNVLNNTPSILVTTNLLNDKATS